MLVDLRESRGTIGEEYGTFGFVRRHHLDRVCVAVDRCVPLLCLEMHIAALLVCAGLGEYFFGHGHGHGQWRRRRWRWCLFAFVVVMRHVVCADARHYALHRS